MHLRWLVFGLSAAAFWIAFFHRVAPGTIANELQSAFAISGAALGALAATYFYVYAVMQVPTGVLVDTLGPRKVLTAGAVIAGVGSVMFGSGFWMSFGLSGSYMSFVGLRRPVAIVVSALYCGVWVLWLIGVPREWTWAMFALTGVCAPGFVLSWVYPKEVNRPRYAGMATSLANSGGFLAAGILQPLVGWVLDRAAGGGAYTLESFRAALAVLLLFALSGFVATLFMRETHCRNIWEEKPAREGRI